MWPSLPCGTNEHVDAGLAVETIQEDRLELVYREENREGAAEPDCEELLARFDLLLVAAKPRGRSRLLAALEAYRPRIRTVDSLPASFTLTQSGQGRHGSAAQLPVASRLPGAEICFHPRRCRAYRALHGMEQKLPFPPCGSSARRVPRRADIVRPRRFRSGLFQ